MKKILALVLIMATFCLAGCTKEETPLAGGWLITESSEITLPESIQADFTSALSDNSLMPVAILGEQVVAGKNYMILCKNVKEEKLKVAQFYVDLQGKTELTSLTDFELTDYVEGEGAGTEQLDGGWSLPEDFGDPQVPEDAMSAFGNVATEKTVMRPIAELGMQFVSGINYALLCEDGENLEVVVLYVDLDGKTEITNIHKINLADLAKYD